MTTRYILTSELRRKLKEPIGTLIRGSFKETMKRFRNVVEKENPPSIICVGDTVSKNLMKTHIFPQLSIVDNKVMRRRINPVQLVAEETIYTRNPPGTITEEACKKIHEALTSPRRIKMVVDGEEDLLTLIAVLYAPENSLIVYGQPYEGIVVVKASAEKKKEVALLLKAMENLSKT